MSRRLLAAAVCLPAMVGLAQAQGVPIQVLQDTFQCRDLSDMIRLGLRRLDGDKDGFLALFFARQDAGACSALRAGTIALLEDVHDEQQLHLVCVKQEHEPACSWSISPRFGPAP